LKVRIRVCSALDEIPNMKTPAACDITAGRAGGLNEAGHVVWKSTEWPVHTIVE
jgi:hypothetical protein